MNNWKSKLTSRKFWVAVVGFVTPMLLAFGVTSDMVTQVASIIMSGGTLIAYIIGEGMIDVNRIDVNKISNEKQANDDKE